MNKNTFLKSMSVLESAFKEKMSKGAINIYWSRLKNYDDKTFKEAVIRCVDESDYFPRVHTLKKLIEGTTEEEAELALKCLLDKIDDEGYYNSISFPKYPAIGLIVERCGGWARVCDMTVIELEWFKKDFIRLYPIMKKWGDYPKELAGQFEIDNSNKGYNEETMLGIYGRKLDGKKVDRKLLKGGD